MLNRALVWLKKYIENYQGLSNACWRGIALIFIESCVIGICFFLSIYFVKHLHLSVAISGLIMSCYGAGTVLGGIVNGKLSDRFSPKLIASINLVIEVFAIFLLAKIHSAEWLMLDLFILGIATFGFATAINVWILDQCENYPEMRVKVINISRSALNIGFALSAVLISYLAGYGFKYIFYFYSAMLCVTVFYLLSGNDTVKHKIILKKVERYENNNHINQIALNNNKKILNLMWVNVFFVGLVISQLSVTYPIYIRNNFPELGLTAVSILFLIDTALIALLQGPLVNALSRYNQLSIVGWGAFLMGIGMFILNFSSFFFLAIISCICWTIGEMLFIAMSQLICYEKSHKSKRGGTMGIYQMFYASSKIIGPTIGAYVFTLWGAKSIWYLSALIGTLCLFGCHYYKKYS